MSSTSEAEAAAASSAVGAEQAREVLLRAERLYADRRRWERMFGNDSDLLHDPALDIILYLFIAERRHSDMSVSSACYAASTPQTTGLRYIAKLEDRGLAARSDDPFDRRRQILMLTERGHDLVARCLLRE